MSSLLLLLASLLSPADSGHTWLEGEVAQLCRAESGLNAEAAAMSLAVPAPRPQAAPAHDLRLCGDGGVREGGHCSVQGSGQPGPAGTLHCGQRLDPSCLFDVDRPAPLRAEAPASPEPAGAEHPGYRRRVERPPRIS